MSRLVLVLAVAAAIVVAPSRADACSPSANLMFVVDPASTDITPPSAVTVHGHYASASERTQVCPAMGKLVLRVAATDDATHSDLIGYRVQRTGGDTIWAPPMPVVASIGELYLSFDPRLAGFVVDLEVTAIDSAGNAGPVTPYHIELVNPNPVTDEPEPTEDGGCATSHGAGWLVGLAIALLAVRRRRTCKRRRSPCHWLAAQPREAR